MDIKKLTVYFIFVTILVIVGYDLYAVYTGGTEATISYVIMTWSYSFPSFSFAMGFLMGHLFWRIRPVKKDGE